MNNIENLAEKCDLYAVDEGVTIELDGFDWGTTTAPHYIVSNEDLEAFAKAYAQQQSEPVWVLSRDNKGRTTNFISGFPTKFDISKLPDGTELFITPPATVPLEKYNKVLDAFKKARQTLEDENNDSLSAINDTIWMQEGSETLFDFMNSAIAEAERKE